MDVLRNQERRMLCMYIYLCSGKCDAKPAVQFPRCSSAYNPTRRAWDHIDHTSSISFPSPHLPSLCLILPSSLLARLQLLHVPATDTHVALILIHAPREVLHIGHAGLVLRSAIRPRSSLILGAVETVIHGLGVGILSLLLLGLGLGGGGTAAEEAADGVPDGGSYGDAAVEEGQLMV